MQGKRVFLILAALIVLLSLGLNLAGNNVGLDRGLLLLPQPLEISTVVRGEPMPHPFYGPLSYYVYAMPVRVADGLRRALGGPPADPLWMQRAARTVCALLGALCTLCVMLIASRGLGRGVTLLAGVLAAFAPGMVFMFHGESVNAVMTLLALATCAAAAWLATARAERIWHWASVALLGSLSAATKESSYGLMPGALFGVYCARELPHGLRLRRAARFVIKALLVGVVALTLYWLINFSLFFPHQLDRHLDHYVPAAPEERLSEAEVERRGLEPPWLYLSMVEQNLGPSTLLWLGMGTILLLRRRRGRELGWLFLSVSAAHYLSFCMPVHWFTYPSRGLKPYDVLFVSALAAVPAAVALEYLWNARGRVRRSLGRGLALLVLLLVIISGVGVDLALLHPSAAGAARLIDELPPGSTLYCGIDVYVSLPEQLHSADQGQADYALLVSRDQAVEGLLHEGYAIEAKLEIPWQAALAPPGYRLQRQMVLLKRTQ
ncbi:MAG: hypothetical protein P9M14_00530 [Candidatus Alcyoniella australis]|nr:hypothetical protein [Candidatus Alcyoniella australis]